MHLHIFRRLQVNTSESIHGATRLAFQKLVDVASGLHVRKNISLVNSAVRLRIFKFILFSMSYIAKR